MIRRNAGHDHFWRWHVLTSANTDREAKRPIFENQTAQLIFEQLEGKKLISPVPNANPPAYLMVYDLKGWEDIIAEGDPVAGFLLRAKRKWWITILSFAAGVLVGTFKSEAIDLMKGLLHRKPTKQQAPENPAVTKPRSPGKTKGHSDL